jgi:hypothetical protein
MRRRRRKGSYKNEEEEEEEEEKCWSLCVNHFGVPKICLPVCINVISIQLPAYVSDILHPEALHAPSVK